MAKKTETARRSFAVDTSSLAAERPVLETGYYAGSICNAGASYGSGDNLVNTLNIRQKRKWNKNKKAFDMVPGEYEVSGQYSFGATLFSKKAAQVLQRDEPMVFGGQFYLNFNDQHQLDANNSITYRAFLTALDLQDEDFNSAVDFSWDDDIVTSENIKESFDFSARDLDDDSKVEELQAVESYSDIVAALNSVVYYRKLFAIVSESVNGKNAKVKVIKQGNYKNPSIQENVIDRGTSAAPFCGILSYTDGFEFDLEDEE